MARIPLPRPRFAGWVVTIFAFWGGFLIGHKSDNIIEQQIERDCAIHGRTVINGEVKACAFMTPSVGKSV